MEELNKFLTEWMGDCYHEFKNCMANQGGDGFICDICEESFKGTSVALIEIQTRNDFLTWEGFGLLWGWANEQDWWDDFWIDNGKCDDKFEMFINETLIDPEEFAKAVVQYLEKK